MLGPREIGQRIAEARLAWDFDATALARQADLEPEAVRGAEEGNATVAELAAIARALGGTFDDLVNGRAFWIAPTVAFRNPPAKVDAYVIRRSLLRLAEAAQHRAELARIADAPNFASRLAPQAIEADEARQGEQLARRVREVLENPVEPIVCVRDAMRRLGVATFLGSFGSDGVDGMSWRDTDGNAFAAANVEARTVGVTALRMTFAHELCHLLFDGTRDKPFGLIEHRTEHSEALERRANVFAVELLSPRDAIARFLRDRGIGDGRKPTAQHLLALSEHFLVGVEACAWQLYYARLWEREDVLRHRYLRTRLRHGEDDLEVNPTDAERIVPMERRGEVLELATLALEEGRISVGRWREFVGVTASDDWPRLLAEREVVYDVEHRSM